MPRRILIVHDDLAEIAEIRRALAGGDHEIALATNASDALAEIARARPDVVLLAPGCDGGEGATVARELATSGAEVALVAIGGEAGGRGSSRVLHSPIDGAALKAAVREAIADRTRIPIPTAHAPRLPARPEPSGVSAEFGDPPAVDVIALLSSRDSGTAEMRALLEAEAELHRTSGALDMERRRDLEEQEHRRAAALARVSEKLEQVRRADYFAILEIERGAATEDVREATRRLLAEMASDRFGAEDPEGLVPDLEEIREVVTDAGEVLADPELRATYGAAIDP